MLNQYLKCFKACDIRGIVEQEIDEKFMYLMGKWMWKYFKKTFWENMKILIGCDVREANTKYLPHFIKGLNEEGIKNIAFWKCFWNLSKEEMKKYPYGICSTGSTYYLWQNDFDIGIEMTASHNPKEYIWMKFFDKEVNLLETSILKEQFENVYFEWEYKYNNDFNINTEYEQEFIQKKLQNLLQFLQDKYQKINKKYKIVVDFSTWAGITVEKSFFESLKTKNEIIFINDYADWTFSAHESDTSDRNNFTQLIEKVKNEQADFGIMFDGDVDRIGFVTKEGEVINCDIITSIIANQILKNNRWNIIFDAMSSKSIEDVAEKYGVKGIRYKTGRYFISEKVKQENWVLWGEVSGHYMFKEIWGYELPLLALYYVLLELEEYNSFKEMTEKYTKYFKTPINSYKTERKEEILEQVKKEFSTFEQTYLDGVSVFWDDFWCNVRASNNENKIRYVVEAETEAKRDEISQKIEKIINN